MVNLSPPLRGLRSSMHVPLHLCPLIVDMSSDVMWYSGQSYPVIYWATRGLEKVKRVRCSYVFKQKYSFKGVGISGKFDQYFPVTDLRKTCCWHNHCEPGHWPLTLFSLKKEMGVIASLLEPNRGRTTCYVNKKATFDQRMRYCSRFIGSLASFNVFIVRLVTLLTTFYTQAKTKAQCGVISQLFYFLWWLKIVDYCSSAWNNIFLTLRWSAGGEIDWEVKVVIICLRHELFLQSQKFGLRLFILNIIGFCCIAWALK